MRAWASPRRDRRNEECTLLSSPTLARARPKRARATLRPSPLGHARNCLHASRQCVARRFRSAASVDLGGWHSRPAALCDSSLLNVIWISKDGTVVSVVLIEQRSGWESCLETPRFVLTHSDRRTTPSCYRSAARRDAPIGPVVLAASRHLNLRAIHHLRRSDRYLGGTYSPPLSTISSHGVGLSVRKSLCHSVRRGNLCIPQVVPEFCPRPTRSSLHSAS